MNVDYFNVSNSCLDKSSTCITHGHEIANLVSDLVNGTEVSIFTYGESLTIVSPNYPGNYPNDANMKWLVSGPEKYRIVAKFHAFDLESDYDFLKVGSGLDPRVQSSELGNLTGYSLPDDVISTNNHMWLIFTSDHSERRTGFWIEIKVFETGMCSVHMLFSIQILKTMLEIVFVTFFIATFTGGKCIRNTCIIMICIIMVRYCFLTQKIPQICFIPFQRYDIFAIEWG